MYDYGARFYDPAVGRFLSVDPLAEKYPGMSSYNYVGNNPINNIDMKGDSITPINGATYNIDRSRGRQAGEYTLHPGNMENASGETVPISVATVNYENGMYEDQWIIHTGQGYSNFMKNHGLYSRLIDFLDGEKDMLACGQLKAY
mgnify:CR=1 FL=1